MRTRQRAVFAAAAALSGLLLALAPAASATPVEARGTTSVADASGFCGYYDGSATTRRGDHGDRVREIQCVINAWNGGSPLAVDGSFGPRTESWVVYFQDVNGLQVDGVVGPETWAALRAV
ncbi:peptidoglycan-binding protein [Streptomyces sp. NPDC059008]|uniref:peptidoglycan-binding domain-containing protein n=1 Tax=Streptomyces sp. NPDC059008 TaxID=3346693 RepID=UPI0036A46F69